MTADTVFRIASVTKTMTAIGLLQLYAYRRIQVDPQPAVGGAVHQHRLCAMLLEATASTCSVCWPCLLFAGVGLVRSVEAALVIVVDRWPLQPSTPPGS